MERKMERTSKAANPICASQYPSGLHTNSTRFRGRLGAERSAGLFRFFSPHIGSTLVVDRTRIRTSRARWYARQRNLAAGDAR